MLPAELPGLRPDLMPVLPGEILKEEFLYRRNITAYRLAKDLDRPASAISEIINGKRAISAEMATLLGAYFQVSPRFWLNLQAQHDLHELAQSRALMNQLQGIIEQLQRRDPPSP